MRLGDLSCLHLLGLFWGSSVALRGQRLFSETKMRTHQNDALPTKLPTVFYFLPASYLVPCSKCAILPMKHCSAMKTRLTV